MTINILILEDEEKMYNGYCDAATELNNQIKLNCDAATELNNQIKLIWCKTLDEANQKLSNESYVHGVIVDLNLDNTDNNPSDASGNKFINEIYSKKKIPLRVVSGNLVNLSDKYQDLNHHFFKKFNRDGITNIDLFKEFTDIHKTGIHEIIALNSKILNQALEKVFWDSLSCNIDDWFNPSNCEESKKSLLRYVLNQIEPHIQPNKTYHNAEFYIIPPLVSITSGDIIKKDNERFILLSPACDVTHQKTDFMVARIISTEPEMLTSYGIFDKAPTRIKNAKKPFMKILSNQEDKYCYIPKHKGVADGVIIFNELKLITFEEYQKYNRIAAVAESFFKNIQARFSSYLSRQGQPDLDKNKIFNKYCSDNKLT